MLQYHERAVKVMVTNGAHSRINVKQKTIIGCLQRASKRLDFFLYERSHTSTFFNAKIDSSSFVHEEIENCYCPPKAALARYNVPIRGDGSGARSWRARDNPVSTALPTADGARATLVVGRKSNKSRAGNGNPNKKPQGNRLQAGLHKVQYF